jgi:uncharacterized membrane protein YcaP (DUF421 family)
LEIAKELLWLLARIITIFPLLLLVTLLMGKRSVAQLPVFDLLVIITLGSVVGADIADMEINHIHTAVAIIYIGAFQYLVTRYKIDNRKFGDLISFDPIVVIQDGKFIMKALRKQRYSIDNVLQMLREKDVFNISEVHLAIIESSGNLSVIKNDNNSPVTIEDINAIKKSSSLSVPVIVEGTVHKKVLQHFNINEEWLHQQLLVLGISNISDVFFASINTNKELHISVKSSFENEKDIIPVLN